MYLNFLLELETIEWIDLRDMIRKPIYMGLHEEVMKSQRIRPPRAQETKDEAVKSSPEENKPTTRIPVARFKPVAERVLRERRDATDANVQKSKREAPEKPHRTSIPKPIDKTPIVKKNPTVDNRTVKIENEIVKEATDETPVTTNERKSLRRDRIPVMKKDHCKIIKTSINGDANKEPIDDQSIENKLRESAKTDPNELDDEFDKLYDEIVDSNVASFPDEILETKVKDPEKLESKFEEIVHQYDDATIEQVKIEPIDKARYSRIPLLRRRSSHDAQLPGKLDRRLSLKTVNVNKSVENEEISESKIEEKGDGQQNGINEDSTRPTPENTENDNPQEDPVEINNNGNSEDRYIEAESPNPVPDYNTIPTPDSELVKVGIFGISSNDIPLDDNPSVATPELETVKVAVIDIPAEDATEYNNKDLEADANTGHVIDDTFKDKLKGIEDNVNYYDNNAIEIQSMTEENPTSMTKEEYVNQIDEKETIKHETIDYEPNHKNISQENIPILSPSEDLKSFGLLKNTNIIEERTKSRYINKPRPEKASSYNNITTLEENIPIVEGKVNRILKTLASEEDSNPNDFSTHKTGKEVTDVKEDIDISKNKSVLSKIAIFERAQPEPPFPKKPIHRYSKPKRTISEEIKHSPKIVQEVLKPKGTEQIDKHTIVTVDITKPVEVITNNEEQVTVVESFKEEVVTYDNFDEARLNKIETVEIEPNDTNIKYQNETVSIEDSSIQDKYNNSEIIDESQETNEDYITTLENKPNFDDYHFDQTAHNIKSIETNNNTLKNTDIVEKWKSTDALADFMPVKEKINRLKSYEDTNMKKAKSTAELDLGDALKGKVKNMIVMMNSSELLNEVTQKQKEVEVISVKERPRKRSVSEKIALFEAMVVSIQPNQILFRKRFYVT